MAVTTRELSRLHGRGNSLAPVVHQRVSNAVAHFAQSLPFRVRCSSDLDGGLRWAKRDVALLQNEIAPDPPAWKTALRFDVDCPCDRQPHARAGYCPSAATYWQQAALPGPSFVVVNPANGHAHYIYLLRGWIRVDVNSEQLAAVRYYAAIERAYTHALHADPGYAGLVQHNPFSPRYQTLLGRDEPYSLEELAAYVTLPPLARRSASAIRTDGRNVETFDRLRTWAYVTIGEYRCGPRETWDAVVEARAIAIATEVRAAHPQATHPYTDKEATATAKSVSSWVWSRYDGGNRTRVEATTAARLEKDRKWALAVRRERGSISREDYLAEAQRRRVAASTLRGLGVAIDEIARRLRASIRSVHRWISEIRCVPSPSVISDFERPLSSKLVHSEHKAVSSVTSDVPSSQSYGAHGASVEDRCEYAPTAHRAEPELVFECSSTPASQSVVDPSNQQPDVSTTKSSIISYIQARISKILARIADNK